MDTDRAVLLAGALLAFLLLPAAHAADFLDPEDAFKFSAAISDGGKTVDARFSIADGYYLYRERFGFAASDGAQLGAAQYPPGKIKFDETFNRQLEIYRGDVVVKLPIASRQRAVHADRQAAGLRRSGHMLSARDAHGPIELGAASSVAAATGQGSASIASPVDDTDGCRAYRNRVEIPIAARGAADLLRARPAAELHAVRAADAADPVVDHRRTEQLISARRAIMG